MILIVWGSVSGRYVRVKVERTTPCLSAVFEQGVLSQGIMESTSLRPSLSGMVALRFGVEKYGCIYGIRASRTRDTVTSHGQQPRTVAQLEQQARHV